MTTTSSSRRRNSAAAAKRTATNDVSAADAGMSTGYQGRAREISKTIWDSMAKLSDIDWKKESPRIIYAQAELEEQMVLYSENKVSRAEVKACYQRFVNAHRGGLF